MVHSKSVGDRGAFSRDLKTLLQAMKEKYREAFYAPLVQSKGLDELTGIVQDPQVIPRVILDLAINLHPQVLRFAVARGELAPLSRMATRADGPAFHAAAATLQQVEKKRRLVGFSNEGVEGSALAEMLLHQALTQIAAWPPATARAARLKWAQPTAQGEELARQLEVTPQAVSKKIRRSRLDELFEIQALLSSWFSRFSS